MQATELKKVHVEKDKRMQELEESGLTREEMLYNCHNIVNHDNLFNKLIIIIVGYSSCGQTHLPVHQG